MTARPKNLEALVAENGDKMGKTSHLSAEEKAALVAYLKTLQAPTLRPVAP